VIRCRKRLSFFFRQPAPQCRSARLRSLVSAPMAYTQMRAHAHAYVRCGLRTTLRSVLDLMMLRRILWSDLTPMSTNGIASYFYCTSLLALCSVVSHVCTHTRRPPDSSQRVPRVQRAGAGACATYTVSCPIRGMTDLLFLDSIAYRLLCHAMLRRGQRTRLSENMPSPAPRMHPTSRSRARARARAQRTAAQPISKAGAGRPPSEKDDLGSLRCVFSTEVLVGTHI